MKLVKAVIRPHKLDPVHEALVAIGVASLTAGEVKAFDRQMQHAEIHRGTQYSIAFMPMVEIEAAVADDMVEKAVETIREKAVTGAPGDGRILVCDIAGAMRIHTQETGDSAL